MSAVLHLMKIVPALPDLLALAGASDPPEAELIVTLLRASSK